MVTWVVYLILSLPYVYMYKSTLLSVWSESCKSGGLGKQCSSKMTQWSKHFIFWWRQMGRSFVRCLNFVDYKRLVQPLVLISFKYISLLFFNLQERLQIFKRSALIQHCDIIEQKHASFKKGRLLEENKTAIVICTPNSHKRYPTIMWLTYTYFSACHRILSSI